MTLNADALQAIRDRAPVRLPVTIAATPALPTGGYIPIETGKAGSHWFVRRLRLKQDSGDATTWNFRLGGASSFTDAEAYVTLRASDTELSTATAINESFEQDDGWVVADANGRIYIKVTFGAGTNHVLSGSAMLEPIYPAVNS